MDESPLVQTLVSIFAVCLLLIWPAVETFRRRRWGWFAAALLLPSVGGWLWLLAGRRQASPSES